MRATGYQLRNQYNIHPEPPKPPPEKWLARAGPATQLGGRRETVNAG